MEKRGPEFLVLNFCSAHLTIRQKKPTAIFFQKRFFFQFTCILKYLPEDFENTIKDDKNICQLRLSEIFFS